MAGASAPLSTRGRALCGLALALALSLPDAALAVAPRTRWRTVVTPHFRIHHHEGMAAFARRLAPIAEEALEQLAARLAHWPADPVHVVLTDETDSPNGFAQVLPTNLITLFAAVPEPDGALGDFDDYWRMLLTHELAHVVHLDTIGGIPATVNAIIGKQLAPNQVQPRWFVEGLAVWLESDLTAAGRIRSSLFDMIVRAQVLDGTLMDLGAVSTLTRPFPGGTTAYLYGGRFLDWVARRHGSDAIAEISLRYGARLVPYGLSIVSREVVGRDMPELWAAWQRDEAARAMRVAAELERERPDGSVAARGLPDDLRAPRFGPDGVFALFEAPRDGDAVITFRRGLGARTSSWTLPAPFARVRTTSGQGAFTDDGRFVAVIDDVTEQRFQYRDLEIIDPARMTRVRRTRGARLSDPDVRAGRVVACEESRGRTRLVTLTVDGTDAPRLLHDPGAERFLFGPRWSPDGRKIAATAVDTDGTRGLVLVDAETGALTRLTEVRAIDHAPVWLPDGRALLFSSDRGGVFDVHRVELDGGGVVRLTREITGAFDPQVDPRGEELVYRSGTARGSELRRARLDTLWPRPARPEVPRPTRTASASFTTADEEPYAPWETMLPKRLRGSLAVGEDGVGATLDLDGADVAGLHSWALSIGYDPSTRRLSYSAGYGNRMWRTPLRVTSYLVSDLARGAFLSSSRSADQRSSVWGLRLGVDVPLSTWDVSTGFSMGYGVELREPLDAVPLDPFQRAPHAPARLLLAPLSAGFYASTARGFEDSISSARGTAFDVGATLYHPSLGSQLEVIEATAHLSHFLSLPWAAHHVLALRLSAGISAGNTGGRSTFSLGGLDVRNVVRDAIENRSASTDVIRGYRVGARRGPAFWNATAEYRLPVFDLAAALDTAPMFADRLHLAVFADFGDTPADGLRFEDAAAGVGAELRLDLVFGYYVPVRVRFGYARGLTDDGIDDVYLVIGGGF